MANTQESRPNDWPSFAVTGDKTRPAPDSVIANGFPQSLTPPTRQEFNWAFNEVFRGVRYLLQIGGVADWSPTEPYPQHAKVLRAGLTYTALVATTGTDPTGNPATWKRWGFTDTQMSTEIATQIAAGGFATTGYVNTQIAAGNYASQGYVNSAIATQQTVQDARTTAAIAAQTAPLTTLVVPTSRFAINTGDVLVVNYTGNAYPAQTVDYAATAAAVANVSASLVAATTLPGGGALTAANDVKQSCYIDMATLMSYSAHPHLASNAGLTIRKYSALGAPIASLVLDAAATANVGGINLLPLSNGNLVAIWGTSVGQFFAIFDKNLNPVVAKTSFGAAQTSGPFLHACALSGGGFAISYSGTAGNAPLIAVYTNAGGVTLAPTAIAGAPTGAVLTKIAQLSNGNLVVVMSSTTAANALSRSIFTAAGVISVAFAVLDAGTKAVSTRPDVSVMAGFYATAVDVAGNIKGYVQSNAGATQGTAYSDAGASTSTHARVVNDGVAFWLFYNKVAATSVAVGFLPVTGGAGQIVNTTTQAIAVEFPDAFTERDYLVANASDGIATFALASTGVASFVNTFQTAGTTGGDSAAIRPGGDFTVFKHQTTTAQIIQVSRYLSIGLFGVAKSTVAAGNPGTLMAINVGPNSLPTNPLPGSPSRPFVHTAATIIANNGILLQNSITVKGF